jgi:hypothetical protein
MAANFDLARLLQALPDRSSLSLKAAEVLSHPCFPAARDEFCTGIAAHFASDHVMAQAIHDTGSYAIFALVIASTLTSPPTAGSIADTLATSLASERRIRRNLGSLADRGLIAIEVALHDHRQRLLTPTARTIGFFEGWWRAYCAPLQQLGRTDLVTGPEAAAAWQMIVATMYRHRGFALIDGHPLMQSLMEHRGGYLALASIVGDPSISPHRAAQRFGRSVTQMRKTLALSRAMPQHAIDRWFATELAFAACVTDVAADVAARLSKTASGRLAKAD